MGLPPVRALQLVAALAGAALFAAWGLQTALPRPALIAAAAVVLAVTLALAAAQRGLVRGSPEMALLRTSANLLLVASVAGAAAAIAYAQDRPAFQVSTATAFAAALLTIVLLPTGAAGFGRAGRLPPRPALG